MKQIRLIDSACSDVTPDFVSNVFPAEGETITIAFRADREAPVKGARLNGLMRGERFSLPLDTAEGHERFTYFRAELSMKGEGLSYHFVIEAEDGYWYLGNRGLQRIPVAGQDEFRIITGMKYPGWVPGAVFYQIFPDRFRSGDDSIGVKPGEYRFDGTGSSVTPWGSPPPEFEIGRCVDFYNGDLYGIRDAIPHFKRLHADALYLNPIFSARTNHRYDCTDYFHVDDHLGGDAALCALTEGLHEAGMHVIIDVSINHTGTDHTWYQAASADPESREAGYYYRNPDGRFACWFDVPTLPQLNYGSEALRRTIWKDPDSLVRHYLRPPFSIDGWRFDVANEVGRRGTDQFCHEIWQGVRDAVKEEDPDSYIIGEHWEDASAYLQGDQWDGSMNYFGAGRPIRSWLGELDRFLMDNWGHDPRPGRSCSGVELQAYLEQGIRGLPNQLQFFQFNLFDSHDTPRLHHHEAIWDWERYCGALYLLFTLPGAVSYFYGDEIGIGGHPRSVEGSRYPMDWDESSWDMRFFELYSSLGALRETYRDLFAYGAFRTLLAGEDHYCCARFSAERAVITLLNREARERTFRIPTGLLGLTGCEFVMGDGVCAWEGRTLAVTLPPGRSAMLSGVCQR